MSSSEAIALTLPVDLAGEIIGCDRQAAYRMAAAGALPVLPGPGRKKVPLAKLSALLGREITAADIEAARARLAPKRDGLLRYQTSYRQERADHTRRRPAVKPNSPQTLKV